VKYSDLIKTTILLCAGAATTLALVTAASAANADETSVLTIMAAWWLVAALIGVFAGRRSSVAPAIGRLLADARSATSMPEHRPAAVIFNRLWPVVLSTAIAAALAFVAPQIPGIACGFTIIWALAWRRQESAVRAIEERDGASFFVERTSPVRAVQLVRTPGFRREVPTVDGVPDSGAPG